MSAKILVVEDDQASAESISVILRKGGYDVTLAATLDAGLSALTEQEFNLVLLDRMMPEGDSIDWLARIHSAGAGAMILILSALGQASRRIEGLDRGADDYLAKPFEPGELIARVRALLRRAQGLDNAEECLTFGALQIRIKARTVHHANTHIPLSPREFDLLTYFARNHENTVTRMQLLEHVWNLHFDPQTNVVDVHVGRLKRKLEAVMQNTPIHSVRGVGYVFAPNRPGDG